MNFHIRYKVDGKVISIIKEMLKEDPELKPYGLKFNNVPKEKKTDYSYSFEYSILIVI